MDIALESSSSICQKCFLSIRTGQLWPTSHSDRRSRCRKTCCLSGHQQDARESNGEQTVKEWWNVVEVQFTYQRMVEWWLSGTIYMPKNGGMLVIEGEQRGGKTCNSGGSQLHQVFLLLSVILFHCFCLLYFIFQNLQLYWLLAFTEKCFSNCFLFSIAFKKVVAQ